MGVQSHSATIIQKYYRGYKCRKRARRLRFKRLVKKSYTANKKMQVQQEHGKKMEKSMLAVQKNAGIPKGLKKDDSYNNNRNSDNTKTGVSAAKSVFEPVRRVVRTYSNDLM